MRDAALKRITESGSFDWPWAAMAGLAIVTGASGGDGGKGFPGETRIVELQGVSQGDRFEIEIGQGGGGTGGEGFEKGDAGVAGADGFVLLVPLHVDKEIG